MVVSTIIFDFFGLHLYSLHVKFGSILEESLPEAASVQVVKWLLTSMYTMPDRIP